MRPEQSRAARALLEWRQEDLAQNSGLSVVSINNFERGETILKGSTLRAIETAFDKANIIFPDEFTISRKTDVVKVLKGPDALKELWDDIFFTLKSTGGEVLITNVDEKRTEKAEKKALYDHLQRLKEYGITERLLSCEGDDYFLMPKNYYRWISKELFTFGTSTYIYADRVALQLWGNSMIILIQSKDAHEAEKNRFEDLWQRATIPPTKKNSP